LVVNAMTLAPGRCPRCRRIAATEQRQLATLRRTARDGHQPSRLRRFGLAGPAPSTRHSAPDTRHSAPGTRHSAPDTRRPQGCVIIQTPLTAPPPYGVRALQRWGALWMANG